MGQILEAELRLVGSDKTAAAFAGVIRHAEELKRALAGAASFKLDDAGARERARAIRQSTAALRAERIAASEVARAYAAGNEALAARGTMMSRMASRFPAFANMAGVGWMAGGIASGRAAHAIARDVADFRHHQTMLATGGMTDAEVARATTEAFRQRVPGMSAADNLKAVGELRMVFGSTAAAIEHLAVVQRAAAAMRGANPTLDAHEEAYNVARALELKGVSMDPAHFLRLTNSIVQAVNATHGKVTGEGYFEFTQYARGAARNLSDSFYGNIVPSLLTEMRPTSAGRAISALYEQVIGAKMKLQSATEWMRLGLLDRDKVDLDKIGHVKRIHPGAFVDSALLMSDPYAWVQGYLKPALTKAGITDKAKVSEEIAHLFSNQFAEQLVGILLTQKDRIEKDIEVKTSAMGSEAAEYQRTHETGAALRDLSAGVASLYAALGDPMAPAAISTMNKMAGFARWAAERYRGFAGESPLGAELTTTAGGIGLAYAGLKGVQATFGLMTGATALKGSALALSQSAAALDAAAARLASVPSVGQTQGIVTPPTLGGIASTVPGVTTALMLYGYMENARTKAGDLPTASWAEWWHRASGGADDRDWLRPGNELALTTQNLRSALSGEGQHPWMVPELRGSADINVKVSAGDGLRAEIERIVNGVLHYLTINGAPPSGTAGSTGVAMPEALPAGP